MRCHLNKLLLKYLKKLHQNSQKNAKKQQYKKSESSARLKKLKFDLVIREERNQMRSTVQEVPYYTIYHTNSGGERPWGELFFNLGKNEMSGPIASLSFSVCS